MVDLGARWKEARWLTHPDRTARLVPTTIIAVGATAVLIIAAPPSWATDIHALLGRRPGVQQ